MMKRILALLWLLTTPSALSLAGTTYINAGEYKSNIQLWNTDKLIVNGGGSNIVEAWDSSSVEIYSTSLPLQLHKGGVYDVYLYNNSTLLFSGGAAEAIVVGDKANALLTGGTINYITVYRGPGDSSLVTIDCKNGWQWLYTAGKVSGITGTWHNGTPFQIAFGNPLAPYPPTANFVNVIPEPASMILFGLGVLFMRRNK
jgi:WD40 repeat protein